MSNAILLRLAAEAMRDPRTVKAVIEGRASSLSTEAVLAAARRLGIELPAPSVASNPDRGPEAA